MDIQQNGNQGFSYESQASEQPQPNPNPQGQSIGQPYSNPSYVNQGQPYGAQQQGQPYGTQQQQRPFYGAQQGGQPPVSGQQPYYGQQPYFTPQPSFVQPVAPKPKKVKKEHPNRFKVLIALISCCALFLSVLAGVGLSNGLLKQHSGSGNFTLPQGGETDNNQGYLGTVQNSSYESVADIVEDVGKSVVTIIITVTYDSWMYSYEAEALGSGIIIGEEGDRIYIATNYHVISSASDVSIIAGSDNSTTIQAYYQGSDEDTDLAVIYIEKADVPEEIREQLKIATLGDSSDVRLGDLAIAIGSPVDKQFGNSVTTGTISGLERSVTITDDETGTSQTLTLMQTDAAINPGNSGGPLVNGRGEVIGINNAKISDTSVEGMGFAIPANTAKPVLEDLINFGKVSRPYIGITGTDVINYQDFAVEYQIISGVMVVSVVNGGPADRAGLEMYDVILTFDGHTIEGFSDLTDAIAEAGIGKTVEVEVLRGYLDDNPETVTLELTIQEKNSTIRR